MFPRSDENLAAVWAAIREGHLCFEKTRFLAFWRVRPKQIEANTS